MKSDSGEVVKAHPSREKALAHLRALKANVEEAAVGGVLDSLLEGFNPGEARGFHGRWVRGRGGKVGRIEGTYHGVKLERGVAYQGKLANGKIHTGVWTGKITGSGLNDPNAHPEFRHVDTGEVRTFQGGEFYGKLSDVARKAQIAGAKRNRRLAARSQLTGNTARHGRARMSVDPPLFMRQSAPAALGALLERED